MRAREFLREAEPNLADALRAAAEQQKAAQQPKIGQPTPPNAVQQPAGTQGSTAPAQTPQAGAKKPMGIGASFVSGLTKGKASSLGGVADMAKQGMKNVAANQLGMKNTVAAMGGQQSNQIQDPTELGMAFKPGQTIDLPNVGKIKVTKSGPQGIELDTSQAASIGLPKLTLNPKDLLQK